MTDADPRSARGATLQLIAHRGYPLHYPENSIVGIRAALDAGAAAIECDVQLSADRHPMVIHDASLQRTAGIDRSVLDMSVAELGRVEVNENGRLGGRFHGTRIPELRDVVELAQSHSRVTFFIEAKRASIRRFGRDVMLDAVLAEMGAMSAPWVIISFDWALLELSRTRGVPRVGWAVERWDEAAQGALHAFAPDYVFCAAGKVPAGAALATGPWRWVVYDINDPEAALDYAARGADFVETDAIGEMLAALRPRQDGLPLRT